uniref:peroxidase n=1 Tax=Solanum lycopersicum TaxID=4081 RepID=A0A3Q7EGR7_SOLLC
MEGGILKFLFFTILVFVAIGHSNGQLRKDFYKSSCPQAEQIVQNITWKRVATNSTLPAKLLRMHFHDCFVRGCDGSILIDSTANNSAEKAAIPNLSLGGFDVIDEIKTALENTCQGVVSCADILTLAARDSVSFQFKKPMWEVVTGRRDGRISKSSEALSEIPSPFFNFTSLKQSFANKSLTVHDLVVLSGGHTIGVGHCNLFSNRLYNFTGKGDSDPSLNSTYVTFLKTKCQSLLDNTTIVEMDPGSSLTFDNNYFSVLKQQKGLFQSDAALLTNKGAKNIVDEMLIDGKFFTEFSQSMKRMGAIGVLTGSNGEIRKKCNVVPRKNFYKSTRCPNAEQLIRDITWSKAKNDATLGAKLLRVHYHDCFVRGCDASILLDKVGTVDSEKEARPNLSLGGFEVIDDIKRQVEAKCPGIVSCADILALSARDAVSFRFKTSMWEVETGRKDGNISLASDVNGNLPSPFSDFATLKQIFSNKGLNVDDLVALSGAHTIGVSHCGAFSRRLFNFTGKGDMDPTLNATYAESLKKLCPNPANPNTTVEMDPLSSTSFDSNYFNILINQNKGLFQSDAALLNDKDSVIVIKKLLKDKTFFIEFAKSMKKMGAIQLLTGNAGEIRKNCRVKN